MKKILGIVALLAFSQIVQASDRQQQRMLARERMQEAARIERLYQLEVLKSDLLDIHDASLNPNRINHDQDNLMNQMIINNGVAITGSLYALNNNNRALLRRSIRLAEANDVQAIREFIRADQVKLALFERALLEEMPVDR